mgnify:CR=1 FL=1
MQNQPESPFESFVAALGFALWVGIMLIVCI